MDGISAQEGKPPAVGGPRPGWTGLPSTVIVLGIVSGLHDLGGDLTTPLLPAFVASLGAGPAALGLIEGVAETLGAFLRIVSGYLADRTGHLKWLTIAGYGIANGVRPFLGVATSWWHVLLVRMADRLGKGIRSTPRDTLLAAATPEPQRGRAFGFHLAVEYLGSAAGPALGFLLLSLGWPIRRILVWSALPGLLAVALLALATRDPPANERPVIKKVRIGLPPGRTFRLFLLAAGTFTLGNSSDAFLLWRARELGVSATFAPLLWIALNLVRSLFSYLGGAVGDRFGRKPAILSGWLLYAAVYLAFGFARTRWQVWCLFGVYGVYYGMTEGSVKAMVVDLVDPIWRGRALGAQQATLGLATLPASLIFGWLYRTGGAPVAFSAGSALAFLATLMLWLGVPSRRVQPRS